jgi:Lon protease-like protein
MATRTMPMFPLGLVLFPHGFLPLNVFEPRYHALVRDCLAGDRHFGVVLIERGQEVGGGDTRFTVGTAAEIVHIERYSIGPIGVASIGRQRVRVVEWLPDAPYPRAEVELLEEEPSEYDRDELDALARLLRRVCAMRAELGERGMPVDVTLSDDPVRASFEAASYAGLSPLDAYGLLVLDDAAVRLRTVTRLVTDAAELLEFRLSS